jgi:hypothetical protein
VLPTNLVVSGRLGSAHLSKSRAKVGFLLSGLLQEGHIR